MNLGLCRAQKLDSFAEIVALKISFGASPTRTLNRVARPERRQR